MPEYDLTTIPPYWVMTPHGRKLHYPDPAVPLRSLCGRTGRKVPTMTRLYGAPECMHCSRLQAHMSSRSYKQYLDALLAHVKGVHRA